MQPGQLLQHVLQFTAKFVPYTSVSPALSVPSMSIEFPTFAFSEHWQLLGPFQIGTREATWGGDPLEKYGGFRNLTFDGNLNFPSSLPFNATASWSTTTAKLNDPSYATIDYASAELSVGYPEVDWHLLQQVYGWAALQWQGWARGKIIVQRDDPVTLALNVENLLEYWIDGKQYFGGDFYGFHHAPVVLHLEPGIHEIDVRLVRDVRALGGITDNPTIDIKLELKASTAHLQQSGRVLIADQVIEAPGGLTSELGSVVLHNNLHEDIWIQNLQPWAPLRDECKAILVNDTPVKITRGQSRPVAFRIACVPGTRSSQSITLELFYRIGSKEQEHIHLVTGVAKSVPGKYDPQKITYLHPGGMVSYAILRPPSKKAIDSCSVTNGKLPVLLALHGAGLEADDELVRRALDPLSDLCAWVLFPTGVTPWSGDDWHVWGSADVEAAVNAVPDWIEHNSWKGPGVDVGRWLVTGHSNGGQGTWHILTHRPDKIIAAAPLSGYSSIQNYVPYSFWRMTDPRKAAIIHSSLGSYRHELLLENTKDIPILQQHGSADDNVPAYHSRHMHQLLSQSESGSTYHEMKGKPHYWDGVFTTKPLSRFFEEKLAREANLGHTSGQSPDFTLATMNPADTGSMHGIRILGLSIPGQLGKIEFTANGPRSCTLYTSNVRLIDVASHYCECERMFVDDEPLSLTSNSNSSILRREPDGKWAVLDGNGKQLPSNIRHGRQLGSMDAMLRSKGTFQIVRHASEQVDAVEHTALQISRNLCQYFVADTEITNDMSEAVNNRTGNVISVALLVGVPQCSPTLGRVDHAITLVKGSVEVRDAQGFKHTYRPRNNGLAAIYLRPLLDERLELVVWGVDEASLRIAARLVPMMTGVGAPDFVITDSRMLWKGIEGTLAMGFLDEHWRASSNAIFT